MASQLQTHLTPSGYLLPSIHALKPFFTQQPNATIQTTMTQHWLRLILSYARHRRLFSLRLEDVETTGGEWDEVFRNERINRRLLPPYLSFLLSAAVQDNKAIYEPPKQDRAVLLYWRTPEEWGEVLHDWVTSTGQLNTILTFYEIVDPPVESPLSGIPMVLLRKAIASLSKTGRSQIIGVADGEGVRFFAGIGR